MQDSLDGSNNMMMSINASGEEEEEEDSVAWICGKRIEGGLESAAGVSAASKFLFFSYRRGFSRIGGSLRLSGDSGWGCSHRSGQMLLARALVRLRLGDAWRAGEELFSVVEGFADTPTAPFSIHALTLAATRLTDKKLGDWLGPASVSLCLRAVVNARQPWGLRAYLAQDGGVIYRDQLPRNGPVLILVPLRLGLETVNPSYLGLLRAVFKTPLCVGVIGGRDSQSFYYMGWGGDKVLLLDPHVTQPAFEKTEHPFPLDSFVPHPVVMPFDSIDPSVSIGFLLKSYEQMDELEEFLMLETQHLSYTISVQDTALVSSAAPISQDLDDWVAI